jgi:kinesin family protein C2/C3
MFLICTLLNYFRGANPAKNTSPLQKKLNGASPTVVKKSGVEGRRTANGKVSSKK